MRAEFFGPDASTLATTHSLAKRPGFQWADLDIRDRDGINALFREAASGLELVVHTAAQPSHDWAASKPHVDFSVNAMGTLNMLEALRATADDATFVHLSTNKVYGDRPNSLPLVEMPTRLELPHHHRYFRGIDTSMSIDRCTHSLFGVSKAASDLLVQEYGRYFGLPTVCFRGGCLTGPAHAGAKLHGFLSYLVKCVVTNESYSVLGYNGKQVRDNIHSSDVVSAIVQFHKAPKAGAVYNLGGGRESNCSVIEALDIAARISGNEPRVSFIDEPRIGDHRWWISDITSFKEDYPEWGLTRGIDDIIIIESVEAVRERSEV